MPIDRLDATQPSGTDPRSAGSPASATTLAVDVGASRIRLALVQDGAIELRRTFATADLAEPERGVVDRLVAEAERLLLASRPTGVDAIGVGLAAFVDAGGGVLQARDFGVPAGTLLRDAFAGTLGGPVVVDNDANLAALAEAHLGVARGAATVALLTLGTNIGLGLVIGGRVHRGAHGAAGEAGLLLVPARAVDDGRGPTVVDGGPFGRASTGAPSGYAWIEDLVGGGALLAAAGAAGRASTEAAPLRLFDPDESADPVVADLVARAVEGWAFVIAQITTILDPDLVVLSGGLAEDAAHLLDRLRRRVGELAPFQPDIRIGRLGPDAELLGADLSARIALEEGAVGHARAGLSAQSIGR